MRKGAGQIESARRRDVDESNDKRAQFNELEAEVKVGVTGSSWLAHRLTRTPPQSLQSLLTESRIKFDSLTVQATQSAAEMTDLLRARTELECALEDALNAGQDGVARRKAAEKEAREIEKRMKAVEKELEAMEPGFNAVMAEERAYKQRCGRRGRGGVHY